MDEIERIERRLKLHDVRVLIAVVEAGSMHKAAERLRTSQPAISRTIADLEHVVGVRLLERSPRGIEPTPYGRVLVKRGVAAFDEFRQGMKDIKFLADPSTGELRIGCSEAMAGGTGSGCHRAAHPAISPPVLSCGDGTRGDSSSQVDGTKRRACDHAIGRSRRR